LMPDSWL